MKFCKSCNEFFEDDQLACPNDGSPLALLTTRRDTLAQQLVGQTVDGRFRVQDLMASGGMGAVYRAVQTSVDRDVALKVVLGDPTADLARRFLREARTTSQLTSVHTVTTLDFGLDTERSFLFLALEYLRGDDLRARIAREAPLSWRRALHITAQVAASLEEAHGKGIVHRDLKSANVFLVRQGADEDFVKVLDFGIALIREGGTSNITRTGAVVGTPEYMAPEQAMGERVDGRADLYALGVILYEMLTGRLPFQADMPMTLMLMHCQELPAPVDPGLGVPDAVLDLLADLLQKSPADRPPDARAVQARCASLLAAGGEDARDTEGGHAPRSTSTVAAGFAAPSGSLEGVWAGTAAAPTQLSPAGPSDPERDEDRQMTTALATATPSRAGLKRAVLLGVLGAALALALVLAMSRSTPDRGEGSHQQTPPAADRAPGAAGPRTDPAVAQAPVAADGARGLRPLAAAAPPGPAAVQDAAAPPPQVHAAERRSDVDPDGLGPDAAAGDGTSNAGPDARAQPTSAGSHQVRLETSPRSGASVFGPGGKLLGRTPLALPSPSEALRLTLRLRGFRRKVVTLKAGFAGRRTLQLRRVSKPDARPQSGPSLLDR